jgi:hypothetical protein
VKKTRLTDKFDSNAYKEHYGEMALSLFLVSEEHTLSIFTANDPPTPRPGQTLIALVDKDRAAES